MEKPILNKNQKEAIAFLDKYGYLIVEAPRRTGKTVLLQEIVRRNQDKEIALFCLSWSLYTRYYREFRNVRYFESFDRMEDYELGNKKFELLIGDEVFLKPMSGRMTACAYTNMEIRLRWKPINKYWPKGQMEMAEKESSEEGFMRAWGQYK